MDMAEQETEAGRLPAVEVEVAEEDDDGIDPDDELYAVKPRRSRKMFAYDWASGYVSPFKPTPQDVAERMLERAAVSKEDLVIDLGSGDGVILLAAALRGAKAVGYDLDEDLNRKARSRAEEKGVGHLVSASAEDLLEVDVLALAREHWSQDGGERRKVCVVMFILPEGLSKLEAKAASWVDAGITVMSVRWKLQSSELETMVRNEGEKEGFWHYCK